MLPARDGGSVVRYAAAADSAAGVLYLAQMAGAFADPWILLTIPVLVGMPIGAPSAVDPLVAALTLAAGMALLLLVSWA